MERVAIDFKKDWPLGSGVTVVGVGPAGLYALAKPEGVRSQPKEGSRDAKALLTCSYSLKDEAYHLPPDKGGGKVWLLHRLDAGTSGVILVADEEQTAAEVQYSFAQHQIKKRYVALVFGWAPRASEVWKDRMEVMKDRGRARARMGQGVLAEAVMKERARGKGPCGPMSLLELEPKTGRTHQLRIQCSQRNLPIVGDRTYGDFEKNRIFTKSTGQQGMFLHAERVKVPFRGNDWEASVPVPAHFSVGT
jgi:23S rRNA-/tRNA-specific pseudouridylate synthase